MGEVPRARNTAQNTLTTWHADRLYGTILIWTLGNCWVAVERASVTSIVLNAVDENPLFSYSPTIVAVFDVNIPRSDAKGIVIRADV
eukprot:scaffold1518_cov158-Skeletonema_marinoi.AAC.2